MFFARYLSSNFHIRERLVSPRTGTINKIRASSWSAASLFGKVFDSCAPSYLASLPCRPCAVAPHSADHPGIGRRLAPGSMSGSITCRTRSQRLRGRMLGASGNAFSKRRDFAGRLGDRFQNSNHGDRSKMLQSPGTAISVRCAVRSPAPTESKTCWGRCIVSVAM